MKREEMDREELRTYYREHRPVFHFASRKGWINDPNGLIFYEGCYHLYYQYYPDGVTHGPMHWGHAVSRNLLEWKELPVALYPDKNGTIFSGCMVYDRDNTSGFGKEGKAPLVAVFTHHNESDGTVTQFQSLAYSMDGGRTFQKYESNPVLDLGLKDFRDPKVFWNKNTREWVMLAAAGKEILFFASPDLMRWNLTGCFETKDMKPDEIWECPDLQEIPVEGGEKRWVLFVSQNTLDYEKTGVRYFLGNFDGKVFRAETGEEKDFLDFGRDYYAAATYSDVSGRVIQQGWMNCWSYAERLPEAGFRGSMTLPRELSLRKTADGFRVIQNPVRELEERLLGGVEVREGTVIDIEQVPELYRIHFKSGIGKTVLEGGENRIEITVDFLHGKITVDRSGCSEASFGPYFQEIKTAYFCTTDDRSISLFLDITSVEIFAAGGEAAGTFQYFAEEPFERIVTGGLA